MKKSNAKEKICGLDSYAALAVLTVAACWFFAGRYGVFGANMDWISQHSVFPEYFRQQFYQTGQFFPEYAANIGGGQNIYNFSYYGLYNPIVLIAYLLPFVKMSDYLMAASVICLAVSVCLLYGWLKKRGFSTEIAQGVAVLFLLAGPMIYQSCHQIMFVQYMPFLLMAFSGVDRYWEKGKTGLYTLGVFLMIAVFLFAERSGIQYTEKNRKVAYLSQEEVVTEQMAAKSLPKTCLVLRNSEDEASVAAWEQFQQIFKDMKVGTDVVDLQSASSIPDYHAYETVVVLLSDVSTLKENLMELCDWVSEGGNVLFALTLQKTAYSSVIEQKLGIISSGYDNTLVDSIYFEPEFMLGGGQAYAITDPYDSAWAVQLSENAKVYAHVNEKNGQPVIWENQYGKGKFVVDNFGLYVKAVRGFYAASYSLLTDVGVYPVINGSTFYLDDFPSPVPEGDATYVKRDYGMSISDFYMNVWWPDMLELASNHNIRYTGVIIENYEDATDGTIKKQKDTRRFQYFGNMLLHQGGELGYHGYNHQPLSLSNVDYGDVLPYDTWKNEAAMKKAVKELIHFGEDTFPSVSMSVYVPPSNVLSAEGREMLAKDFPEIRTIASNYFTGEFAYVQEFEVAKDGIVEQPRIISGAIIDNYMKMAALSELNMHFVNSHFIHPDDLLDEDRGAALGWEKMKGNLADYMDWLVDSAPSLRQLTGSELSGAIQRYGAVTFTKTVTERSIELKLKNFYDEAYFMVRINEGTPGEVSGGKLTHLTGNLYLLQAKKPTVTIEKLED